MINKLNIEPITNFEAKDYWKNKTQLQQNMYNSKQKKSGRQCNITTN